MNNCRLMSCILYSSIVSLSWIVTRRCCNLLCLLVSVSHFTSKPVLLKCTALPTNIQICNYEHWSYGVWSKFSFDLFSPTVVLFQLHVPLVNLQHDYCLYEILLSAVTLPVLMCMYCTALCCTQVNVKKIAVTSVFVDLQMDFYAACLVIVWRLRGNIIWTVLYWQRATSSMGTVNRNSSHSPVGPW